MPTQSKGTGEGNLKYGERKGETNKKKLKEKGKILTVDEKTIRDTNKSVKQQRHSSKEHRGAPPLNGH
jgi:hypothetical protein